MATQIDRREPGRADLEQPLPYDSFKRFADHSRDIVYRYDLNTRSYLYWNEVGLLTYGRGQNEHPPDSRKVLSLIIPEDRDKVREAARRSIETGARRGEVEYRICYGDGETLWMHDCWTVVRNERGKAVSIEGVVRNTTERRRMEVELGESRERYRKLVETMNDGFVIADAEDRFSYVNDRMCEILKRSAGELTGRPVIDFVHEDDKGLYSHHAVRRKSGDRVSYELHWKAAGAPGLWAEDRLPTIVSPMPMYDEAGGFVGSFAVVTDITEQKRVQRKLEEREQELAAQNQSMENLVGALKTLLKRRERDKDEVQQSVVRVVRELIEPYVGKLSDTALSPHQQVLLDIIEGNIRELVTTCSGEDRLPIERLTTAEAKVANLVKIGRTTKEIAKVLNVSIRTVETHRYNIRKKIGVGGGGVRLRNVLLRQDLQMV